MKENISIDLKNTSSFISYEEIFALAQKSVRHLDTLNAEQARGMISWDGSRCR